MMSKNNGRIPGQGGKPPHKDRPSGRSRRRSGLIAGALSLTLLAGCQTAPPATRPATSSSTTSLSQTLPAGTTGMTGAGTIPVAPIPQGAQTSTEGKFSWRNATVYYAMTDRFYNGDPANDESYGRRKVDAHGSSLGTFNGGDFKGLTQKLAEGYFTDLGITALWISAPYEQIHGFVGGGSGGEFAHYAFHGYYGLDWTMTDRNFGTRAEFEELVDTAHGKGIRVILDVVMNHPGYNTLADMDEYDFGVLKGIDGKWQPAADERYDAYQELVDYDDEAAWARWWGKDWIRTGLPGYDRGGSDDYTQTLAGLPDFKTESTEPVSLPPVLKTKWAREAGAAFEPWRLTRAKELRQDLALAPAGYLTAWLSAWVEEFGIDGFRIDTAKHVQKERWQALKASASEALAAWRRENPSKPGAEFTDEFFMVGEVWGAGLERTDYYDQGFDALINFTFQGETLDGPAYRPETLPKIYRTYAETLAAQNSNVLSYISSHDTRLFPRNKLISGLTAQLLLPGALEVFYGDETARPYVSARPDLIMGTRGPMNWTEVDEAVKRHFEKLGQFRARNLAVGAGRHTELSAKPFVFQRTYEQAGFTNTIVVALDQPAGGVSLEVGTAFPEGALLRDAYTGYGYRVENGQVLVAADPSGIVLLEQLEDPGL